MVSASAVPVSPLSNMLRYIYAISRFHRRILDCSYSSKKWLTFGAFRVNQKALMTEGDRIAVKEAQQNGGLRQLSLAGRKLNLRYVVISKPAYRKFYEKISNRLLWFLQHYMYDPTQDSAAMR